MAFERPSRDGGESPRTVEMHRVADALRAVIERFVATRAPVEVFAGFAAELERIAADLAGHPQESLYLGYAEAANADNPSGAADPSGPFEHSPFMGRANPLAPPVHLEVRQDRVVGRVFFTAAYEGPPGHLHGGYVAAVFDELLGLTQTLGGKPGMTAGLDVKYRSPTPLYTELHMEGTLDRVDGRKTTCSGRLYAGDRLCAEAEGLFVSVDLARFLAMREARDAQRRSR